MSAKSYITSFVKRGGISVFLSTAVVKFSAIILSIGIVRILSKPDFGMLAYALSVYGVGVVLCGFGGQYSLLRYGSLSSSQTQKRYYYSLTMYYGCLNSLVLALLIILFAFFPVHPDGCSPLLVLVGLSMPPFFIIELQRSYFRVLNLNRIYSKVNLVYSVILLAAVVLLSCLLGSYGYLVSFVLVPLLIFYYFNHNQLALSKGVGRLPSGYWTYGLHTTISSFANQLIFSIAPFLLGLLGASEADIADFKVATIIPFNLLTLPGILMITDFNFLSKNYLDAGKLVDYYKSYLKVIIPCATVVIVPCIIFGKTVLSVVFGAQYINCYPMYVVFMIATYITFFFRNPLGNILLAVGKASWNGFNAYLFCVLYIIFTLFLYKYLGVYSAVYGLSATFVFSGFLSLFLFRKYISSLKNRV